VLLCEAVYYVLKTKL